MPNHVWTLRDEFRLTLQPVDLVFNILVAYCAWLEKSAFIWFDDFSLWFEHEASTFTCSCCLEGTIGLHTQRRYYAPELQVAVATQKGLDASHGAKCKQTRALSTADHQHFFSVTTVVTVAISITNPSPMAPVGRVLSCGHCAVVASPA